MEDNILLEHEARNLSVQERLYWGHPFTSARTAAPLATQKETTESEAE